MESESQIAMGKFDAVGRRVKFSTCSIMRDTNNSEYNNKSCLQTSLAARSDEAATTTKSTHEGHTRANICNTRLCTAVARRRRCRSSTNGDTDIPQSIITSRESASGSFRRKEKISCSSMGGSSMAHKSINSTGDTNTKDKINFVSESMALEKPATRRKRTCTPLRAYDSHAYGTLRSTETCQHWQRPHVFTVAALHGMEFPVTTTRKGCNSGGICPQNPPEPDSDAAPANTSFCKTPAVVPFPPTGVAKDGVVTASGDNDAVKNTALTSSAVTPGADTEQGIVKQDLGGSATSAHTQGVTARASLLVDRSERASSATEPVDERVRSARQPAAGAHSSRSAAAAVEKRTSVFVASPHALSTVERHSLEQRLGGKVPSNHHMDVNSVSSDISPSVLYDDGEGRESATPATSLLQHFLQHQKQHRSSLSESLRRRCSDAAAFSKGVFRRNSVSLRKEGPSPSLIRAPSPQQQGLTQIEQQQHRKAIPRRYTGDDHSGTTMMRVSTGRGEPHPSEEKRVAVLPEKDQHESGRGVRGSKRPASTRGSHDRATEAPQEPGTRWDELTYGGNHILSRYSGHSHSSRDGTGSNSRSESGDSRKHMAVHVRQRLHGKEVTAAPVLPAAGEAEAVAPDMFDSVNKERRSLKLAATEEDKTDRRVISREAQTERRRREGIPQQQTELSQPEYYNIDVPLRKEERKPAAGNNGLQWISNPLNRYSSLPQKPSKTTLWEEERTNRERPSMQQVANATDQYGGAKSFPSSFFHTGSWRTSAVTEGGVIKQMRHDGSEKPQRDVDGDLSPMQHSEKPLNMSKSTPAGGIQLSSHPQPTCAAVTELGHSASVSSPYVEMPIMSRSAAADHKAGRVLTPLAAGSGAGRVFPPGGTDSEAADISATFDSTSREPRKRGSDTDRAGMKATPETGASSVLRAQHRKKEEKASPRATQAKSLSSKVVYGEGAGEEDTHYSSTRRKNNNSLLSWFGWRNKQRKKETETSSDALLLGYFEKATVQVANAADEIPQLNTNLLLPLREQRARRLRTHVIIEIKDGLHRILEVQVAEVLRMLEQQCEADEQEQLLYLEERRRQRAARSHGYLQRHRSDERTTSDSSNDSSSCEENDEETTTETSYSSKREKGRRRSSCGGEKGGGQMNKNIRDDTEGTSTHRRGSTSFLSSHDRHGQYKISAHALERSNGAFMPLISASDRNPKQHPSEWSSQIDSSASNSDVDGHQVAKKKQEEKHTSLSEAATPPHESKSMSDRRRRRKSLSNQRHEEAPDVREKRLHTNAMLLSRELPHINASEEETSSRGQSGKQGTPVQRNSREYQIANCSFPPHNDDIKTTAAGSRIPGSKEEKTPLPPSTSVTEASSTIAFSSSNNNNMRNSEQRSRQLMGGHYSKSGRKKHEMVSETLVEEKNGGRVYTKRRNKKEAICCTGVPHCCAEASRTWSSMSISSRNSDGRREGSNSIHTTCAADATSTRKIDAKEYDRESCNKEETDIITGIQRAEGVRLPLKSKATFSPGELLRRGLRKEKKKKEEEEECRKEREKNVLISTTCRCCCPCCEEKNHIPASSVERWCRGCCCCCKNCLLRHRSQHISSTSKKIKRHLSRIHTPSSLSRTSSITSLSAAVERQHRYLEMLQQLQQEQRHQKEWKQQQAGSRKRRGGPDTGRLTYRDCRQAFTDVHPVPSIEVRRHVVLVCLPPVTCFVLWDRVFLLMTDDLEPDHLISQLSKLTRYYAALERKNRAAELGGGDGGEGSPQSLLRDRQIPVREVSGRKTSEQQQPRGSLQRHLNDETPTFSPSHKKTRQEIQRGDNNAASHISAASFPVSHKEKRLLSQEHIYDDPRFLQHPGDIHETPSQMRYQQLVLESQGKGLRHPQHAKEKDAQHFAKVQQRYHLRTCYSSDEAPEALLQDAEEAAASANEDAAMSASLESVERSSEAYIPQRMRYKRQSLSCPFADYPPGLLRDHNNVRQIYRPHEPVVSGSVESTVGHRNKYMSQTNESISRTHEAAIESNRLQRGHQQDDHRWMSLHQDHSPTFREEERGASAGHSLCVEVAGESDSDIKQELRHRQAELDDFKRTNTSTDLQYYPREIPRAEEIDKSNGKDIHKDSETFPQPQWQTTSLCGAMMPEGVVYPLSSPLMPHACSEQLEAQLPGGQEHQQVLDTIANAAGRYSSTVSTYNTPIHVTSVSPLPYIQNLPDATATDTTGALLYSRAPRNHDREHEERTAVSLLTRKQPTPSQHEPQAEKQQIFLFSHLNDRKQQQCQLEEGQEEQQQRRDDVLFHEAGIVSSVKEQNEVHCINECKPGIDGNPNRSLSQRDDGDVSKILSSHINAGVHNKNSPYRNDGVVSEVSRNIDGGDSNSNRISTHIGSTVHNITSYIHESANKIMSSHIPFVGGKSEMISRVDGCTTTVDPSRLHDGGVQKVISLHADAGANSKSLTHIHTLNERISTHVSSGANRRMPPHVSATKEATSTSDSDASTTGKFSSGRASSSSAITRRSNCPSRSLEHKRQTSSAKHNMPFEFAALECIFFAAFQQLNFDIVYLEKKFAETHQRAAKKSEASSILMEGLHSLKEPVALYEDRVTAFDKAFDELLSNNVDLHRMELTRLHHNPGLYDYDPHKDEVDPELEILLEYFDQEMDQFKGRVRHLKEGIDNTERLISLRLALMRNRLIQWELAAAVVAAGIAIGTCISGIFGMNLANGYEDGKEHSHDVFTIISSVIAVLAVGSVAVVLYLIRTIVL